MTTIPHPASNIDLIDYLSIDDLCKVLELGRTTVTKQITNDAQVGIHYIPPTSAKIKKNLFKKSFIVDRVKIYNPAFDTQKIIDYRSEVLQPISTRQVTPSGDNQDLVKSLYSHIDSLTKQVDSLVSINNEKDVQIAKHQESYSESNRIISDYQKQVQILAMKETLTIETPKSETLKENDISSQPNQKKGLFGWW